MMTTDWTAPLHTRGFCLTLLLAVSIVFAVRSYQVFGPDSVYVQPFNSDSALPVLMANDNTIDLFRTYNYGQDQIGAWPFLFGQLIHKSTGYNWTPKSIYLMQVAWLSLSILLAASLSRPYGILIGLIVAVVLSLNPAVSHYFFVLNQRNAWQCSSFLLAWFFVRQLCDRLRSDVNTSTIALSTIALAGSSFLAVWSSSLDGPFLLAIAVLELLRLEILEHSRKIMSVGKLVAVFGPVLTAMGGEAFLKACYHRHSLKHFGSDFKTPTQIDWGNFGANLSNQWHVFTQQPWLLVTLLGMVASITASVYLVLIFRQKTRSRSEGVGNVNLMIMIAGCGVIGGGSFLVTLLFTWVRLNSYGPRYLAQTEMFGSLAGLATIVLLARIVAGGAAERIQIIAITSVAVALILLLKFPLVHRGTEYAELEKVANGLLDKGSPIVLLGGYWDTYSLAALAAPGKIVPVPAADQLLRTPWTVDQMRKANLVVVVHHEFPRQQAVETPVPYETFGDGESPPSVITQYGVTMHLVTPNWYEQNGYRFSLYRNDSGNK